MLTDNGSAFRSKDFAAACKALGVRHRFTRPYRPQTNGKAERFIQSALREWAYGFTCQHQFRHYANIDTYLAHAKKWLHDVLGGRFEPASPGSLKESTIRIQRSE